MKRFVKLARLGIILPVLLAACSPSPEPLPVTLAADNPAAQPTAAPTEAVSAPQPALTAEVSSSAGLYRCLAGSLPEVDPAAIVVAGPTPGMKPSLAEGQPLAIEGIVYGDDCTPLAGARVSFHHTDGQGNYGPPSGSVSELECCYYQGQVASDAQGRFRIETVRPGSYAGENPPPMAHIHLEINHPDAEMLPTEIVFADDPHLIPDAAERGLVVVQPVEVKAKDGPGWSVLAEFVLERSAAAKAAATPASGSPGLSPGVQTFTIQPGESRAFYIIREQFAELVNLTVAEAVTPGVEGDLSLRLDSPPVLEGMTVRVDLRQLKSDESSRDDKLPDRWLETNRYPYAEFRAEKVQLSAAPYTAGQELSFALPGQISIHGQTRPIEFQVTARLEGEQLSGSAEASLLMSDFGIEPPNILGFVNVEDEVRVRVELNATQSGAVAETVGQPGSIKPAACPVTQPNGSLPPGEETLSENYLGNGQLWTVLWPAGTTVIVPEADGRLAMKFPWWRAVSGGLTISGRQLDGAAPPLSADIPDGYGETGFQASAIFFPAPGCWEITGRAGEASLTFVTRVVVAEPQADAQRACPVSEPAWALPPKDSAVDNEPAYGYYYINADSTIWASAYWTDEAREWLRAGDQGVKVGWFRPAGAELVITGQRLDGDAPPLLAHASCCYPTRFQASGLYFPTEGCWEVNAKAGGSELTFVVWVLPPP